MRDTTDQGGADHVPDPWAVQRWAFSQQVGGAARKAVLMALAVMSGTETGRCEARVATLCAWTELSERSVRAHLRGLVEVGLVAARPQYHVVSGQQRGNEYLLLAPWVTAWPDGLPAREGAAGASPPPPGDAAGRIPGMQPATSLGTTTKNGHASTQARAARARGLAEQIPDDFPDELRPHARAVMRVLRSVAEQHGAREVTPLAVARVLMAHPRHPVVETAHALAAWAADPPRPIRDVVGTYRSFLKRERALACTERLEGQLPATAPGAPPAGVVPLRPGASAEERRMGRQERRMRQARGEEVAPRTEMERLLLGEGPGA